MAECSYSPFLVVIPISVQNETNRPEPPPLPIRWGGGWGEGHSAHFESNLESVSLRPRHRLFYRPIVIKRCHRFRHRWFLPVFGPNIQIVGRALRDLLEHRRGRLSAVIALLRFVHHHRNAHLGIVRREKADKRGEVLARRTIPRCAFR